ncbi:MAG: histidine phosphatase family protein [Gaiellaceae bacterium]
MATTIVMVRHGETDWNRERRFQGHADVPLNEAGRSQVRELAERLFGESFSLAYTSPLRRASESAEILAAQLGFEVRPSEALKEVDVGSWSGLTTPEVEARFPDGYRRWVDWRVAGWDDGESYEVLGRRVVAGLYEIAERHPDEHLLAVTHGGPIRSAMAAALMLSLDEIGAAMGALENCAVVRLAVRNGGLEAVH